MPSRYARVRAPAHNAREKGATLQPPKIVHEKQALASCKMVARQLRLQLAPRPIGIVQMARQPYRMVNGPGQGQSQGRGAIATPCAPQRARVRQSERPRTATPAAPLRPCPGATGNGAPGTSHRARWLKCRRLRTALARFERASAAIARRLEDASKFFH
jgi:hypothetical protein